MDFIALAFKGAILFVSSDFIKEQEEYVPANQIIAEQVAGDNFSILPTPELVDEIYRQATCKITSPTMNPADPNAMRVHNLAINKEIVKCKDRTLIAGHKKTVVQTTRPGRLAIYGWFRNGKRVQPYSTIHVESYIDYSHGIRLVSKWAVKNGKIVPTTSILDP